MCALYEIKFTLYDFYIKLDIVFIFPIYVWLDI